MNRFLQKILTCSLSLFLIIFVSCKADNNDDGNDSGGSENLDFEISSSADSRGQASVSFNTVEDVSKFTVSAISSSNSDIRITRLTVDGTDYLSRGGDTLSLAQQFSPILATATVPSRQIDTNLTSPQLVAISAQIEGTSNQNQIVFKVTSRKDGNLSSGTLNMNIFYVGSIGSEESTKNAVQNSLRVTRNIFADQAGINLRIVEQDISGRVQLPLPSSGDSLYLSASEDAASPAVNVFIGGDIDASSTSGEILGISSSIPGPAIPSAKSAVAVSIFASAGSDGVFDDEDLRILGETIAHESAHFMGLFHPVDFNGNVVSSTDPLDDTPTCSFNTQCVADQDLIRNLMFTNPVPDNRGNFIPQNRLTSEQRGVLNRYAAVD